MLHLLTILLIETEMYAFKHLISLLIKSLINLLKFDADILKIVDKQLSEFNIRLSGLKCDISSLAYMMIYNQAHQMYLKKVERLLYSVLHGNLVSSVATVLSVHDLSIITAQNAVFQNTLYVERPELLFRTADFVIADIADKDSYLVVHYVLVAPKLFRGDLHQTYISKSVPVSEFRDSDCCFEILSPEIVILAEAEGKLQ